MKQLTLGELVDKLLAVSDPSRTVIFDFGTVAPTDFDSYRGYYDELALGYEDERQVTVAELLAACMKADGATYMGYKGGLFVMTRHTPVWVSNFGQAGDTVIVDVVDKGWCVFLVTAHTELDEDVYRG